MATARVNERPMRRHTHEPNGHALEGTERCPWCGSAISRTEFERIKNEVAKQARARIAKVEKSLNQRFTAELDAVKQKAAELAQQQIKKAAKATEQQLKKIAAERDAVVKARVEAERESAAKRLAAAVNAEKVRHYTEKTRLTEQLAEMQRKMEQKTAHQLGEPAELDLFTALETAFPDDHVRRVRSGARGPDVIHEIVHQGEVVGSIVLDSKNYSPRRWSNALTRKLRGDQLREGADFGILSSSAFPSGARELHIQDGVIVASPQRVIVLTHLLRRVIIDNHVAQLSQEQRSEKADRLYSYICSPGFNDLLGRIVTLTDEIADLDRTETATHQKVWNRRTALIAGLQAIHGDLSTTVSGIIAGEQGAAV